MIDKASTVSVASRSNWSAQLLLLFFLFTVEELASEFYRDIEVASLVDPERIKRKSTTSSIEDSSSSISRDSK